MVDPARLLFVSMGYGGKRLFSFGVSGHRFPQDEFARSVQPWLEHDAKEWGDSDEVLEGAGCWSPLFPARHDGVVLAAATGVKELETLVAENPSSCRFRSFRSGEKELIAIRESIRLDSSLGRALVGILLVFAQMEREATGERTREAVRHIRALGYHFGKVGLSGAGTARFP